MGRDRERALREFKEEAQSRVEADWLEVGRLLKME